LRDYRLLSPAEAIIGFTVEVESNAIQVTYFGKGQVVLYWNKKLRKIEDVQTED